MRIRPRPRRAVYRWLQAGAIVLIAGAAGFSLIKTEKRPVGPEELRREATELRSEAARGKHIADAALAGEITPAYFREQLALLGDRTEQKVKKLDEAKPQARLESARSRLGALARRARRDLQRLAMARDGRLEIARVKDDLADVVRQLAEFENTLGS